MREVRRQHGEERTGLDRIGSDRTGVDACQPVKRVGTDANSHIFTIGMSKPTKSSPRAAKQLAKNL